MLFEDDLQRARAMMGGDAVAFRQFADQAVPHLATFLQRRVATPALLEQALRDALSRALDEMPRYRGDVPLFAWLCQLACAGLDRTADTDRAGDAAPVEPGRRRVARLPEPRDCPGGLPRSVSVDGAVGAALAGIPPRLARVLEWRFGDGASVEAIAQLSGQPAGVAQELLLRARSAYADAWRRLVPVSRSGAPRLQQRP